MLTERRIYRAILSNPFAIPARPHAHAPLTMRFSLCASVALISTLVYGVPHEALHAEGTGLSSLEPRQALNKKPGCLRKGVHIIAGSGAGGAHIRGYGLLSTTVDAIRAAVPGSSNYSVPFVRRPRAVTRHE